jgi:hypothetical protein
MTHPLSPSALAKGALAVIELIKADMEDGTVPTSVTTFSELHDYVDANMYLIEALYEAEGQVLDSADEVLCARDNRVMDFVNVWLGAKH